VSLSALGGSWKGLSIRGQQRMNRICSKKKSQGTLNDALFVLRTNPLSFGVLSALAFELSMAGIQTFFDLTL